MINENDFIEADIEKALANGEYEEAPDFEDSKKRIEEAAGKYRGEKPCCMNTSKRCQHWAWQEDGSNSYINSLSGRVLGVGL